MKAQINRQKDRVSTWTRKAIIRGIVLLCIFSIQLWLAVFGYLSFYYLYMPVERHEQPVFFEFSACRRYGNGELCPFPSTNITFAQEPSENRVMMRGQEYEMVLELDMPQSPVNERQGTFMAKLSLYSEDGSITRSSARPVTMKYRSWLYKIFDTLLSTPTMLLGYSDESQLIKVNLLGEYVDHPFKPAVGAVLELQALKLEVYRAKFIIHAQFSGIRYLMYYWPIITALFSITMNFSILSIISLLSWVPMSAYFLREVKEEKEDKDYMRDLYDLPGATGGAAPGGDAGRHRVDREMMARERQALFGHMTQPQVGSSLLMQGRREHSPDRLPSRRSHLEELHELGSYGSESRGKQRYPTDREKTETNFASAHSSSQGSSDGFEQLDYDVGVMDVLGNSSAEEDHEPEGSSLLRHRSGPRREE